MMTQDPYAAPAYSQTSAGGPYAGAVPEGAIQMLAQTKPWVRLISVMIFIGAALMLVGGVAMFFIGGNMSPPGSSAGFKAGFGIGMAIFYMLFAFLYIYPGVKLWKYASAIARLMRTRSTGDLEFALAQQRSFWRFFGILILIFISLYVLIIVGAVVIGGIGAMKS